MTNANDCDARGRGGASGIRIRCCGLQKDGEGLRDPSSDRLGIDHDECVCTSMRKHERI